MPQFKEINDKGAVTIDELRESQRKGSEEIGTSTKTFAETNATRNHGTGLGEGSDPQFPAAGAGDAKLPWE
jgi:hypothetical protein